MSGINLNGNAPGFCNGKPNKERLHFTVMNINLMGTEKHGNIQEITLQYFWSTKCCLWTGWQVDYTFGNIPSMILVTRLLSKRMNFLLFVTRLSLSTTQPNTYTETFSLHLIQYSIKSPQTHFASNSIRCDAMRLDFVQVFWSMHDLWLFWH